MTSLADRKVALADAWSHTFAPGTKPSPFADSLSVQIAHLRRMRPEAGAILDQFSEEEGAQALAHLSLAMSL